MEESKIGFFKKVKKSICNFEYYINFARENTSKAWSYYLKLILIFALITTSIITYQSYKIVRNITQVVKKEVPNFSITEEELKIENDEVFAYKDGINILMDGSKEEVEESEYEDAILFLKNKINVILNGEKRTIPYSQILALYNLESINKEDIGILFEKDNLIKTYIVFALVMLVINFVSYFAYFLLDILVLAIIGQILNYLTRTNLKFVSVFKMSIHAITLPMILMQIYIILNILLSITVKNFNIAYDAISYIYIITVLLMIKSDIVKNQQLVGKAVVEKKEEITEEREEEKEEKEEPEEEKKEEKKENKETPGEPEGSKA